MFTAGCPTQLERWASMNDFLTIFARGEQPKSAASAIGGAEIVDQDVHAKKGVPLMAFNAPSLAALDPLSSVRERISVLRLDSKSVSTADLVTFAARNRSRWGLEALVQRFTRGLVDWNGFREELLRGHSASGPAHSVVEQLSATKLWLLRQALLSHHLDLESEHALLVAVADRVVEGERFDRSALPALAVNLIGAGLDDHVQKLLRLYTSETYLRHALTVELAHPRFGGSHELLLERFNQVYRRFGLETVTTEGDGTVPFTRLRAQPAELIQDGPLVSVIMSCWSPGEELLLAVRSIVDQTYQNWELIVTDDASPHEFNPILEEVSAMDPRVRVVRNDVNGGTYVRRNEALNLARGEFVTMQDSDDWSHPRRLEIQSRDLQTAPDRLANIIYNVRLTEDLSLYSERGMQLGLCEPAIMFRRKKVLRKIGYFDDVRKAADREFRQRLEAATGIPVAVVGPEIPLVLMLADVGSLSGSDFRGKWVHPARIAYRSSMLRTHDLISDSEHSPVFPARQTARTLDAPEALLGRSTAPSSMDLVVVLDGRAHSGRRPFLAGVVEELRTALESGLTVGVMHSDSLFGGKQQGYFDASLQRLVDEEGLHRVIDGQHVNAETVVIRHAVALQGHPTERRSIATNRVVVVEDAGGGDARGTTFAKPDVIEIAAGWFGTEPEWHVAAPRPLPPTVEAVVVDADELRITVKHSAGSGAVSVKLRAEQLKGAPLPGVELRPAGDEGPDVVTAVRLPIDVLGDKPFQIVAQVDSYDYVLDVEVPRILSRSADRVLVRRPHQRLQLVDRDSLRVDVPGGDGQPSVQASIRSISVADGRVTLEIEADGHTRLTRVVAIREVHGRLRRRGLALKTSGEGQLIASRQVLPLAELRWQLFGVFQTAEGRVQHPLGFAPELQTSDGDGWRVRVLGDHVMHIVPSSRPDSTPDSQPVVGARARLLHRWLRRR